MNDSLLNTSTRAREIQCWLRDHLDEHMASPAPGHPEWWTYVDEFEVVEAHLQEVFHVDGCVWDEGCCPEWVAVTCAICEMKSDG